LKKIFEPSTVITDGILFICGLYFWLGLAKYPVHTIQFFWGIAYFAMAFSAFAGALRHGWGPHWSPAWSVFFNRVTYFLIGITSITLLWGVLIWYSFIHMSLQIIITLSLILYCYHAFRKMDFKIVILYYFPIMIIIFILMLIGWYRDKNGAGTVAVGIGLGFLAAALQRRGWDPHRHFNHNDIYHVVQLVGMWLMYTGLLQLK